jgi:gamma-glutamyltranspeptidase
MFGLAQGKANAVGAGRRILSATSPTVAWRGHEPDRRDAVGFANAVRRRADGALEAAADPRGGGAGAVGRPKPGTMPTSLKPAPRPPARAAR